MKKRIKGIMVNDETNQTILIGTDPEFEVLSEDGDPISADDCGSNCIDYDDPRNSQIGIDGSGKQFELRPNPSETAEGLVKNIKELLQQVDVKLSVAGNEYAVGCHIHFGIGKSTKPTDDLLWLLDYFLAKPFWKLNGEARCDSDYAQLSAYRCQPHGFEYRSTPAGVLRNEKIATLFFKVAKTVVEKYYREYEFVVGENLEKELVEYCGLTKDEARYYVTFADEYVDTISYQDDVVAAWCSEEEWEIIFEYSESWSIEAQNIAMEIAENYYLPIRKTIKLSSIKKDRGICFTNKFGDFPVVDTRERKHGIPYYLCFPEESTDEDIAKKLLSLVIEKIIIKEGGFNCL
jgi:hypothetical protein